MIGRFRFLRIDEAVDDDVNSDDPAAP